MIRNLIPALLSLALALPAPVAGQTAPADSLLSRANDSRVRGLETAPVTIIELADFQCPFCREFAQGPLAEVDSALIKTGKAKLVFYNLTFPNHTRSWVASEAALCAGVQGGFWQMHDRLFAEQATWTASARPSDDFDAYAAAVGLDLGAFRDCTREDRMAPLLAADLIQGVQGGANATPTFVLLREPRAGEAPENAQRVLSGVQPLAEFVKAVEELSR